MREIKISFNNAITWVIVIAMIATIIGYGWYLYNKNKNPKEDVTENTIGKNQNGTEREIIKITPTQTISKEKKDDWQYTGNEQGEYGGYASKGISSFAPSSISGQVDSASISNSGSMALEADSSTIGLSTGGAKNVENFRENIKNGYFPISTDITYNGLFYDYTFDTGKKQESTELFSPSYSTAISKDPISEKDETYMTVGLNSNIKQSDFERKKLNLVVVLDISGSMSSGFNKYYYDQFTARNRLDDTENITIDDSKSKMQIASESLNILLAQLKQDDKIGVILFDDSAYIGKPISKVGETDIEAIKNHILEIKARGGTNFEAGYKKGTDLFNEYINADSNEYENRIIFITDAMPNYGETTDEGLLKYVKENADKGIYTSFIGVGVDFNTKLIEKITDVKGANYYSVHNSEQFKRKMGEEFEYMVTPLVFDLQLNLKSADYEIEKVYGSDTANIESGNLMKVNTLFPSKTTSTGEVKGGIVLLKLKAKNANSIGKVTLDVLYKDRNNNQHSNSQTVEFKASNEEKYDNTGIRKAIVLTRYANTIKNWIMYERTKEDRFIIIPRVGIMDCDLLPREVEKLLGEQERTSVKLTVSENYKEIFKKIKTYIQNENNYIKDDTLNQEVEILNILQL